MQNSEPEFFIQTVTNRLTSPAKNTPSDQFIRIRRPSRVQLNPARPKKRFPSQNCDSSENSRKSKKRDILTKTRKKRPIAENPSESISDQLRLLKSETEQAKPKKRPIKRGLKTQLNPKSTSPVKTPNKPDFANLDKLIPQIKRKLRDCMSIGVNQQANYNLEQSEKMISQYESFRFQNLSFLKKLVDDFSFGGSYPHSNQFILKFLLDIQTPADLAQLSAKELYFLEYFLVNRYFKVLRNKVLGIIQESASFGKFLAIWGFVERGNINEPRDLDFGWISHKKAILLWSDKKSRGRADSVIFDDGFSAEIVDYLKKGQSQKLFESFAVRFYDLIQLLIVKFIVNRFGNTQLIFDEVECIEKDISELLFMVMDAWSIVKSAAGDAPELADLGPMVDSFCRRLRRLFPGQPRQIYLDLIKYIKFREMREYLERKKKSKFVRYRRNDEKIKKIYKHIMIRVYTDFKKSQPSIKKSQSEILRVTSPNPDSVFPTKPPCNRLPSTPHLTSNIPQTKLQLGKRATLSGDTPNQQKVKQGAIGW